MWLRPVGMIIASRARQSVGSRDAVGVQGAPMWQIRSMALLVSVVLAARYWVAFGVWKVLYTAFNNSFISPFITKEPR